MFSRSRQMSKVVDFAIHQTKKMNVPVYVYQTPSGYYGWTFWKDILVMPPTKRLKLVVMAKHAGTPEASWP